MSSDWYPNSRLEQTALAKTWAAQFQANQGWGVPQTEIAALQTDTAGCETLLQAVMSEDTRTPVKTEQCRLAFKGLETRLRRLYHLYCDTPPRDSAERVMLSLSPKDHVKTRVNDPVAQPTADVGYPGPHLVELHHFRPFGAGDPDPRAMAGQRVYWGIMPPGGADVEAATGIKRELMKVPVSGEELPHSNWTRRRKELFNFDGDSGKTVYFSLRYETGDGRPGPFGPIFSAVIP